MSMLKLYVLDGGDIICRDVAQLNSGMPVSGEIELANPVFLIQHPKGSIMWDAGLSDDLIRMKEGVEAWIFHLSLKKTLIAQLAEIGMQPEDIQYIAFSHMHNDHTGNASYYKHATLIMQEKEYNIAFDPNNRPYNYSDYKDLENAKAIKLNGDHDFFGDGTVRFISTPGHTPGHQSLLISLPETGPIIISGDVSYYRENYANRAVPTYNSNREESLASIEKLERLVKEHKAQLWIQHDKDQFAELKHSPLFYQ
jgi:glyoxylase-like metal-dependent hydrolase (beta-lactamase superfamily II)